MKRLTLKWRVAVYAAIAHVLVGVAGACVLLFNAQHAVRVEIVAAQDSAVTLIEQLAETLASGSAGDILLTDLSRRIIQPRHVNILIVAEGGGSEIPVQQPAEIEGPDEERAPDWFLRLVRPDIAAIDVPLVASGSIVGRARVSALPNDEANEVWEDVKSLFLVWVASTLAMFVLVSVAIGRALAPIERLEEALRHLEAGDYSAKAAQTNSPDLRPIGIRIDRLTQTLQAAERERSKLSEQLLHLRDEERKELARELHDELGPCLFGLTAEVDALRQNRADAARSVEAIGQLVGRIRATNARILNTLRPQTIGHLPLTDVVADLLADFQERNPEIAFESDLRDIDPPIDEPRDLTVYRVVQEAVNNALRHAAAKRIHVGVDIKGSGPERLSVSVRDFGDGLDTNWQEGRGLIGMRERLSALRGTLALESAPDQGTLLRATLPLTHRALANAPPAEPIWERAP